MTATQVPTPGPLTAESTKLLVKGDWLLLDGQPVRFRNLFMGGIRADSGSDERISALPPRRFAFIGRPDADGWMPWSGGKNPVGKYDVAEIQRRDGTQVIDASYKFDWLHSPRRSDPADIIAFRLAPTAPVEAGGLEREVDAIEVEDMEWPESPLANDLYRHIQSQFCLHPDEAAEETGEVLSILARHGVDPTKLPLNLRPQPSGETRDVYERLSRAFKANIYDHPHKSLSTEAENTIDLFASVAAEALSTTPARAEAQDEGAAGWDRIEREKLIADAWDFVERSGSDPEACKIIDCLLSIVDAHPSPTPAADADRVRIAVEALEPFKLAANNMDGDEPDSLFIYDSPESTMISYGDLRRAASAFAALKSTAAKEGGE